MMCFGNLWGHDFAMHIHVWTDAEHQFEQGVILPRWAADANFGYGQPFFLLYPPLSWYVGGALGLILPWEMVPGAYVWLMLVVAGAAMWKCASEWLDPPDAVVASILYAMNPYIIVMIYRRTSYAELFAAALLPLLIWASLRMGRDARNIPLLALALAAIWLSDLPAAVLATYTSALLLTINSIAQKSLRPILYGGLAIFAGFGTAAFFMLPAVWEQRWVEIGEVFLPGWLPDNNFLFRGSQFVRGLSFVALSVIVVTFIAALLARRMRTGTPGLWTGLTALAAVSTFMMFKPSSVFWRILPKMQFVSFPFRWLSALCVAGALLTASAIAQTRRKRMPRIFAAIAVVALGAMIIRTTRWDSSGLRELIAASRSRIGYTDVNAPWANPLGSHPSRLPHTDVLIAPAAAAEDLDPSPLGTRIDIALWSPERKLFSVDLSRSLLLKLKLLTYPAWQAKLDGKIIALGTDRETGQMLLAVPSGLSHVEITFVRTWDRTVGIIVSVITLIALLLLTIYLRRRESPAVRS